MIPAETQYETHNAELLAIVEAFKTWCHYLEGCKHKVLVLIDHNNLWRFMNMKSLSSHQVRWAQELSRYHFQIDYQQGKANGSADALSRFPLEKLWWRRKALSRKQSNSLLCAVFSHKSQPFRPQFFKPQPRLRTRPLTARPSPYLRHVRPTAAWSVFGTRFEPN